MNKNIEKTNNPIPKPQEITNFWEEGNLLLFGKKNKNVYPINKIIACPINVPNNIQISEISSIIVQTY